VQKFRCFFVHDSTSSIIVSAAIMCRSIKILRRPEAAATSDDVAAASLQFVRKVSGFHAPSRANQPAFDAAVRDIAESTQKLLEALRKDKNQS
jgi:hypothetical protein